MRRRTSIEEMEQLYYSIGRAVWHIQFLEDALHTLSALKLDVQERGAVPISTADAHLAQRRRATLGNALTSAEKSGALSPETLVSLRALKEERDWLIHRCAHEVSDMMYTDSGRAFVFERLDRLANSVTSLRRAIAEEVFAFCRSKNISPEEAEATARIRLSELSGEPAPEHR